MSELKITNNMLRIAEIYTNKYSEEHYGREISRYSNLPQKTVSRELEKLSSFGIMKFIQKGRNKIYFLDKNNPLLIEFLVMVESYKAIQFLSNNPKLALYLKEINYSKVIFGSYAKGNQETDSDIDMVLLTNKNINLKTSPIEIHAQYSSLKKFKGLLNKSVLAQEIADNHIIMGNTYEIVKIFMGYYYG